MVAEIHRKQNNISSRKKQLGYFLKMKLLFNTKLYINVLHVCLNGSKYWGFRIKSIQ